MYVGFPGCMSLQSKVSEMIGQQISLHLLDFTFPLCTCSEPQNSYMIEKEIVIDFIKSVLGETPNNRSFSHNFRVLCEGPLGTLVTGVVSTALGFRLEHAAGKGG